MRHCGLRMVDCEFEVPIRNSKSEIRNAMRNTSAPR